jgi:hypothetical protein
LTEETLKSLLTDRINSLDASKARLDIERFNDDPLTVEIWTRLYFIQNAQKISID